MKNVKFSIFCLQHLEYGDYIPCKKRGSSSWVWGSVGYLLIAITPRSTLTKSESTC